MRKTNQKMQTTVMQNILQILISLMLVVLFLSLLVFGGCASQVQQPDPYMVNVERIKAEADSLRRIYPTTEVSSNTFIGTNEDQEVVFGNSNRLRDSLKRVLGLPVQDD